MLLIHFIKHLATIVSQKRQQLSLVSVRGQSRLLLDRLEGLGGGAGQAAKRRSGVRHMAWRGRRRAQQVAARQGRRAYRFRAFRLG